MKFLFKFPSRSRPNIFKSTLKKHISFLSGKNEYKFIFTFDVDDPSMNNESIRKYLKDLNINFELFYGFSKNKIEAINANMENHDFDILVLIADDMIPILKDYDEIIKNLLINSEYGLDSMVHFYTSRWADILDVWCIMGKKYYDRFNYIYHPEYKSICADNEYTEVATILNRRIFSTIQPFHHENRDDSLSQKNWYFNTEDDRTYYRRKSINFDID